MSRSVIVEWLPAIPVRGVFTDTQAGTDNFILETLHQKFHNGQFFRFPQVSNSSWPDPFGRSLPEPVKKTKGF
jgi:hypothetical protein